MKFNDLVLLVENNEGIRVNRYYWDRVKKKLKSEYWYKDSEYHRLDGPAIQYWYENGQKGSEQWFEDSKYHRIDGPAVQCWYANGQKENEWWYKAGKLHRLDGPAIQEWDENGNKIREEYFINGKELTPNEFKQLHKQYNSDDLDILNDLNT
jgi:antitoxin component YwqK of YwqJK toxin-antitoxin module